MQLLRRVLDKKPNFTNNYVNFNKPDTFAATFIKPMESSVPPKPVQQVVSEQIKNEDKIEEAVVETKPLLTKFTPVAPTPLPAKVI